MGSYRISLWVNCHVVNVYADELAPSAGGDERPDLSETLRRPRAVLGVVLGSRGGERRQEGPGGRSMWDAKLLRLGL
jgi:hypothetical protein